VEETSQRCTHSWFRKPEPSTPSFGSGTTVAKGCTFCTKQTLSVASHCLSSFKAYSKHVFLTSDALTQYHPPFFAQVSPENEAYQLSVWRGGAWIVGTTVWGALHGLRSLSQLSSDENGNGECTHVTPTDLLVEDSPRFAHRGFLLDTAHVKLNVPDLLAALRFASSVKLNVFHWHLTDHQSWGVSLPGAEFLSGSCPQSSCYSQARPRCHHYHPLSRPFPSI
jgi:N-acetyl-beta-hexosaminidase